MAAPLSAKQVSIEELRRVFPTLDPSLIEAVHADCRGWRSECIEQLSIIAPPRLDADMNITASKDMGMENREETCTTVDGGEEYIEGYDEEHFDPLAVGEEKAFLDRVVALGDVQHDALERIAEMDAADRKFLEDAKKQKRIGAQSLRGGKFKANFSGPPHHQACFRKMIEREELHCGEYVCLYHSYSLAALLYEVQACIARTLYGLPDDFAALPRLMKGPFRNKPHISVLLKDFKSMGGQDHHADFRQLAISSSVSLFAPSSEAPPTQCFSYGYSCSDLSLGDLMNGVFRKLGLSASAAQDLKDSVLKYASGHGLITSCYGKAHGAAAPGENSGHMLQIFVHRTCVDDVAYGSQAYGVFDTRLNPLSDALTRKQAPDGQARIFVHPTLFCDPTKVIMYHYAANEQFHKKRREFQRGLLGVLRPLFAQPSDVIATFRGVEGLT